jgi:hypothetical protein
MTCLAPLYVRTSIDQVFQECRDGNVIVEDNEAAAGSMDRVAEIWLHIICIIDINVQGLMDPLINAHMLLMIT